MDDGNPGMLVEGLESEISPDASSLGALEAVRHTPMMISVFEACFAEHEVAERLFQQLEDAQRCSLEAVMRVADSQRCHHIDLCRAADPKTGLPMIVMGEFDITTRKALETAQLVSKRQLEVIIEGLDCREAAQPTKEYFAEPEGFVARIEELIVARRKQTRDLLAMADGRFLERAYTPC